MRMKLPLVAASVLVLAGCANPWNTLDIAAGATPDQVVARAGQPTRVLPLPGGGERMQYTMQPLGQYAFNVDVDATGHVVHAQQVLTEANFNRIVPGQWTVADVEREFGPPARVDRVSSFNGNVLTYRWYNGSDMFYFVYVDPAGVVRRAHQGMEFHNAPNDARS